MNNYLSFAWRWKKSTSMTVVKPTICLVIINNLGRTHMERCHMKRAKKDLHRSSQAAKDATTTADACSPSKLTLYLSILNADQKLQLKAQGSGDNRDLTSQTLCTAPQRKNWTSGSTSGCQGRKQSRASPLIEWKSSIPWVSLEQQRK